MSQDGPILVLSRLSIPWGWSEMVNFMAVTTVVLIRADGEFRLACNRQQLIQCYSSAMRIELLLTGLWLKFAHRKIISVRMTEV